MRKQTSARVVASADELAKAFAIRSAVFIGEQNCPYDEEFDGNDFCATHILGCVGDEPVGTVRLRWFADFAKLERVCVLSHRRFTILTDTMIKFAVGIALRKGYRQMYGHAQKRLVPYWAKYGFKPIPKNAALVFSDHEYVEMVHEMEADADAITLQSDPYVMLRPEGAWDRPGILECSASRKPTNPH